MKHPYDIPTESSITQYEAQAAIKVLRHMQLCLMHDISQQSEQIQTTFSSCIEETLERLKDTPLNERIGVAIGTIQLIAVIEMSSEVEKSKKHKMKDVKPMQSDAPNDVDLRWN